MAQVDTRPKEALDTAIEAARVAKPIFKQEDGRLHALIPEGFNLAEISDPHRLPPMIAQSVKVDDRASLEIYTNRFSDDRTIILADFDAGTIRAVLDWHKSNDGADAMAPQHAKHSVTLHLRDSLEYQRWNDMEGTMHSQEDFARFIEENVTDVSDPDHSTLLEICRDLEATQGSTFKAGTRLENGDRSFRYETETRVTNEIQVPTEIGLEIPLYFGEEPTFVRAKFRFRASQAGLALGFVWHRVEYQRQAAFQEIAFAASENTGRPVIYGRT